MCMNNSYPTLSCSSTKASIPEEWIDMTAQCTRSMRNQIQEELSASMQYLAMGAHFSRDTVNRPGFAEMFFKSASEEREHAMKLMSYLMMRGELTERLQDLIRTPTVPITTWADGLSALKDALKLEASVTKKIKHVIKACENDNGANDYHLVDYLTGEFLEEQYSGQRDLAGKISTLGKMMNQQGVLGEFLFDKKLLG
ncbi:ferritin subunit isoform X1 [Ctenocephalides felis]|uniref:ferritin subunit isoform X1 n=1 Tax=Ctenocephalides felis TaxID=7515 RepID=UPI000E6E2A4E|nr:ferritin subunit isoform X1 [Ctenocephalides felis]